MWFRCFIDSESDQSIYLSYQCTHLEGGHVFAELRKEKAEAGCLRVSARHGVTRPKRRMSFMSHEVSYRKKIEASFSEHLELHHFPLDRQLCRIKLIAESPIED